MSKKIVYKSYINASVFCVLRYPVPATFGVPGMCAVIQQALHRESIPVDTTFIAFTEKGNRATMIYIAPDGSTELVKRHASGRVFDTAVVLATSKARTVDISEADLVDLLSPGAAT